MPKNSKEKLPRDVASLEHGKDKISPIVAVSETLEDYENDKVTFSFERYNSNQCRIGKIDKKEAKKLTKELKKISTTLTRHFRHQGSSGIACKPVHNSSNYSVLFKEVPEDTELLEIDYSKAGRIFGYIIHSTFNVVAIGKEHW